MSRYEEGLKIIEECCGNGKDNVIVVSTIDLNANAEGKPSPCVRDVDAIYDNGTFYITTWGKSNKIQQIAKNNETAFVISFQGISGKGIGENLGWVLDPKNAEIRTKLRSAFADWYDQANNEQSEECVILAIHITRCTIFRDHGAVYYNLDLVNKSIIE